MTAGALEDLLLVRLVRHSGGSRRRWRRVLGEVRVYDPATHPHCNWHYSPSGTIHENAVVETLLDEVRGTHPRIAG